MDAQWPVVANEKDEKVKGGFLSVTKNEEVIAAVIGPSM